MDFFAGRLAGVEYGFLSRTRPAGAVYVFFYGSKKYCRVKIKNIHVMSPVPHLINATKLVINSPVSPYTCFTKLVNVM